MWINTCALVSYLFTIGVNTIRIVCSIYLYDNDIHYAWFTPDRVHQIIGILIYFFFLSLLYFIMHKIMTRVNSRAMENTHSTIEKISKTLSVLRSGLHVFIPLVWYWFIVIVVPVLNKAYQANVSAFLSHCVIVISVSLVVFLLIMLNGIILSRTGKTLKLKF